MSAIRLANLSCKAEFSAILALIPEILGILVVYANLRSWNVREVEAFEAILKFTISMACRPNALAVIATFERV